MKQFKNILYIFNVEQKNKVGLQKACKTAILNKANLNIIITNAPTNFVVNYENEMRNQIAALLSESIKLEDIPIYFSHGISRIDIIKKVISDQYDLVITEPDVTCGIKKFFYGTTTLALLRECPCIVWVAKPEVATPYKKIMAAVDPASDNPHSKELTDNIIELAVSMAQRNQAECHIVHAWYSGYEAALENPFFGSTTKSEIENDVLNEKIRHVRAFEAMLKRQTVDTSYCITHIIKGDAKKELAEFSVSENIDLIVMGTVEKTGIEGFFVGNTAESLINQVECSILAIKPAAFVSPIK